MVPILRELVYIYVNAFVKNLEMWFDPYAVLLLRVDSISSSWTRRT